jgi:hypothetical protein
MNTVISALKATLFFLLLMGAAFGLGYTLVMWASCFFATVYIVRRFAAMSERPWFSLLAGIAVPGVFGVVWSGGPGLGTVVLDAAFPEVSPHDLPDARAKRCVRV